MRLTRAQARRLVLRAQGFDKPRPARVTTRALGDTARRLAVLQMDAVNVLERAHYLPLFSRLGPYDREALDGLAYRRRALVEYWGHEASLLPIDAYPLLRWRMARGDWWYPGWREENAALIEAVYDEVAARGPLKVGELADPGSSKGPWWGWSDGKRAMEWLFFSGRVTTVRREHFERVYDVTERVLPRAIVEAPTPPETEAIAELVRRSVRALGVGTAPDITDYFRLPVAEARAALGALVAAGEVVEVEVEGWRGAAFKWPAATVPRAVDARAFLSPFDNLIFNRKRVERLFDFHYRIEIYTPAPKRTYGYYVLPFLLGDQLVGRVDLKNDRRAGVLRAKGTYIEDGADPQVVAPALADELRLMAGWLGARDVAVDRKGNLARALRAAL